MRFTAADLRALQARGLKITQQTGKKKHAESYAGPSGSQAANWSRGKEPLTLLVFGMAGGWLLKL